MHHAHKPSSVHSFLGVERTVQSKRVKALSFLPPNTRNACWLLWTISTTLKIRSFSLQSQSQATGLAGCRLSCKYQC